MKILFMFLPIIFAGAAMASQIYCDNPRFVQYKFLGHFQSPINAQYSCRSNQAACVNPQLCPQAAQSVALPQDFCPGGQVVVDTTFYAVTQMHSCVSRRAGCFVPEYCELQPPNFNCPSDSQADMGVVGYEPIAGTKYVCPKLSTGCVNDSYCPIN